MSSSNHYRDTHGESRVCVTFALYMIISHLAASYRDFEGLALKRLWHCLMRIELYTIYELVSIYFYSKPTTATIHKLYTVCVRRYELIQLFIFLVFFSLDVSFIAQTKYLWTKRFGFHFYFVFFLFGFWKASYWVTVQLNENSSWNVFTK